jgi:MoaA/NifB/PqqE/SkfB family radical SAM enzyme
MNDLTQLHLPARYPLCCQWELTCRCNLRCAMCYTDCFNQPEFIRAELRTDEILRIMDELSEAGTMEVCLTGGEPLARPDFMIIYERAIDQGFLVTLFTNGTLLTPDIADRLALKRPKQIEISLHGITKPTFERVTQGKGSYERCMEGIGLIRARHLPLVLKTVAMTLNQDELFDIKRAVEDLDAVGYKLGDEMRPLLNGDATPMRYGLARPAREALFRQDADLWQEFYQRESTAPPPCQSGMKTFHIDAYGMLQLCSGNRQQAFDLRRGSFKEGFYEHLPSFECPRKTPGSLGLLRPTVSHG